MNTIPEVGSKWDIGGPVEVTAIRKRGRGYQVEFYEIELGPMGDLHVRRLRDFLKAAKPL